MGRRRLLSAALLGLACSVPTLAAPPQKPAQKPPKQNEVGKLEVVANFTGPMPTGVTVSQRGRVFVNFPRWGDRVPFSVAEIKNGKAVAYPDANINRLRRTAPGDSLVCVQSVVVDARDRLWIVDAGAPLLGPAIPNGPKLVCVDLKTNTITKKFVFPPDVVPSTSYLNDVRFDLRKGTEGVAYITDSGAKSANGIIVVDLATGQARRRLANHPSVKAEPKFLPLVENQPLMQRKKNQPPQYIALGSDGIALSADGSRLFYTPLASRKLYSVSADALWDTEKTDADVAATVKNHGAKSSGSDGLETDNKNRIYATLYENYSVARRSPDGTYQTVARDPRLIWPDTLSVAANGYLYIMANQLNRQKDYHKGNDLRVKPYQLLRVKIDAGPVLLK